MPYQTSQAYDAAIRQLTITSRIEGTITQKTGATIAFDDDSLGWGSVSINSKCVDNSNFQIGTVYSAELTMSLLSDVDRYSLYDAVIALSYFLMLPDNTWEEIPLGIYNITEANRIGSTIEIQAYDNMILLDDEALLTFDSVDGTVFNVLSTISELSGIPLTQTQEEIEALPNGKRMCGIDGNDNVRPKNLREVLSYLAGLTSTVAVMDRHGAIELRTYSKEVNYSICENKQNATKISDYMIEYGSLSIKIGDNSYLTEIEGSTGLCYNMDENPMISNYSEETRSAALMEILSQISGFSFTPSSFELVTGDPAIDLGDMVQIRGIRDTEDQRFNMLNMSFTWAYHGKQAIECLGSNPKLSKAQSKESAQVEQALNSAEENRLVFNSYTNVTRYEITADTPRQRIATIQYTAMKQTWGEFKLQAIFEVANSDPQTIVKFTYFINDNEVTTIYPIETYVDGKHVIALYYPIESIKANTVNKFDVYIETTGGNLTIEKMNCFGSVIGQGMASMKEEWDGTLSFEEDFSGLSLPQQAAPKLGAYTDQLETSFDAPTPGIFEDNFTGLKLKPITFKLGGFMDSVLAGLAVKANTLYGKDLIGDSQYLQLDADRLSMRTSYTYVFVEQPIDEGRMCGVTVDTGQFASVEKMEVTE
ncbi:hypothetical protein NE619_09760 [Anaerovorax odorimutans]|uniref:Uncharacterized protein n=1 Tax=Anaerovorax odorimutans TaxID=109327 RepID=A0ABT1RQ54_9FIRM|nr:hypothetical protein [Anaerovorax odorimutans]MCQ4637016.1 hypothetical protein [Anaerovorax odorimutans]